MLDTPTCPMDLPRSFRMVTSGACRIRAMQVLVSSIHFIRMARACRRRWAGRARSPDSDNRVGGRRRLNASKLVVLITIAARPLDRILELVEVQLGLGRGNGIDTERGRELNQIQQHVSHLGTHGVAPL